MIVIRNLEELRYIISRQLETAQNMLNSCKGNETNRREDIAHYKGQMYGFSQSLLFIDKLIECERNKEND